MTAPSYMIIFNFSFPFSIGSKRNSLDKQSVQTLAQDLAAECAKAYALMENSLSKLSSELGVTPFGLAPKNKV